MMMTHPGWLCNSWESSFRYYTQLYCYRIKGCWMYVDGWERDTEVMWMKEGREPKQGTTSNILPWFTREDLLSSSNTSPIGSHILHSPSPTSLSSLSYSISFLLYPSLFLSLSHSITQPDNVATLLLNERHTNATSTHTASVYSHFVSIRKFFIVFVILHYERMKEGKKERKNGFLVLGSSDQGRWQTFTVFQHSSRLIQPTDT